MTKADNSRNHDQWLLRISKGIERHIIFTAIGTVHESELRNASRSRLCDSLVVNLVLPDTRAEIRQLWLNESERFQKAARSERIARFANAQADLVDVSAFVIQGDRYRQPWRTDSHENWTPISFRQLARATFVPRYIYMHIMTYRANHARIRASV